MRRAFRWIHTLSPEGWAALNVVLAVGLTLVVVLAAVAASRSG